MLTESAMRHVMCFNDINYYWRHLIHKNYFLNYIYVLFVTALYSFMHYCGGVSIYSNIKLWNKVRLWLLN